LTIDAAAKREFQTLRIQGPVTNTGSVDFKVKNKLLKIPYALRPSLEVMPGSMVGPDGVVCKADWWIHPAMFVFQGPELASIDEPAESFLKADSSLSDSEEHSSKLGIGLPSGELGLEPYVSGTSLANAACCTVWHAMRHLRLPRSTGEDSVQGMFTWSHVRMIVRDLRLGCVHSLYPTRYQPPPKKGMPQPAYDDWDESPVPQPK
jgi:hypothetical protein